MLTIWDEFGGSAEIHRADLYREQEERERDRLLAGNRIAELEARLAAIESGAPKPIVTKSPKPRPVINGVPMGKRLDYEAPEVADIVLDGLPDELREKYLRSI